MKKGAYIGLILLFLMGNTTVSRAFTLPQVTPIATLEELETFGRTGGMGKIMAEIRIDRPVTLDGIEGGLATVDYPIHILSGGSLTVDSPALELMQMGEASYIIVDAGGTLRLDGGTLFGAGKPAILVAEGGTLEIGSGFLVEGALIPGWTPPMEPEQEPETEPEPQPEPEPAPIADLWGEVRRIQGGMLNYSMILPRLEMESLSAIYVERSSDGETWERRETFRWDENVGYFVVEGDSWSALHFGERNAYITYVEKTDYQDFYLRLELEGSPYAGRSNTVKVVLPKDAGSGGTIKPPTTGDYEDMDGNRGGGGQGESDRVKPTQTPEPEPSHAQELVPEPSPTPVEVPAEQETLLQKAPEPSAAPVETAAVQESLPPEPPAPSRKAWEAPLSAKKTEEAPRESPESSPPAQLPPPVPSDSPTAEPSKPVPAETPPPPEASSAPSPAQQAEGGWDGDMLWLAAGATLLLVAGGSMLFFRKRKP